MEEVLIVVVEDNPDEARMTLQAIAQIKPPVLVGLACDGEEALELLVGEHRRLPKLIFLDLKLPKVNGFEVLSALREDPGCNSIPVVIFSSSADPKDIDKARTLGANDYICKPIDWDDYVRVVCEAVATYVPSRSSLS